MRSTATDRLTLNSTSPSTRTLNVCMNDTITPSSTASIGRPFVPTRYAAITVLP